MGDRDAQQLSGGDVAGEICFAIDRLKEDVLAAELERAIADQGAGEQARFAKNLETVADAEDSSALRGKVLDCLHDGTEPSDRAGAQVIPIAEAAGNDDGVGLAEGGILVPYEAG